MAARARQTSGRRRRRACITLRQARRLTGGPQAMETRKKKFIPNTDVDFETFAIAFADIIAKHRSNYGVSAVESDLLTRRVNAFVAAYQLAKNPEKRNKKTIGEKKAARKEVEKIIRPLAALIRANRSISRGDKVVLNIHERPES